MVIATGKVVGGRVELDSALPEGASVTVLAREGDETFEADTETERVLLDAIAQCERGDTIPVKELLDDLRSPRAASLIALQPQIGTRARNVALHGVRRLHLARIRYDLYYRLVEAPRRVEILAFWHARRGSQPQI